MGVFGGDFVDVFNGVFFVVLSRCIHGFLYRIHSLKNIEYIHLESQKNCIPKVLSTFRMQSDVVVFIICSYITSLLSQ